MQKSGMVNENTAGKKKSVVILLITTALVFICSYGVNKLYTFSCFSYNGKRAIMIGMYLIDIAYSIAAAKLARITLEDMGILSKLFRRYLFLLIPGMMIQLLRVCMGKCALITGIYEMLLYLLVAAAEETVFRGLLLALLMKISRSSIIAILIQAVIFGLMHYPNAGYGNLSSCFEAMFLGAIFACIRVYLPEGTGTLTEGMGFTGAVLLHWVLDMCAK